MLDSFEIDIQETKVGSAKVFRLDTELELDKCFITAKNEAKVVTKSGRTEITKSLTEGNFIAIITRDTRFSFLVVVLPSAAREIIDLSK